MEEIFIMINHIVIRLFLINVIINGEVLQFTLKVYPVNLR